MKYKFRKIITSIVMLLLLVFILSSSVYASDLSTWNQKTSKQESNYAFASAYLNGKLYTFGGATNAFPYGINKIEEYDISTNTWSYKTDMITGRAYSQATVVDGTIYLMGGITPTQDLDLNEAYNPVTNTWVTKQKMPAALHAFSSIAVNKKIYVIGGYTYAGTVTNSVYSYDTTTNTWATLSPLSTPKACIGLVALDNKIYAFGGQTKNSGATNSLNNVDVYDIETNSWSQKNPMLNTISGENAFVYNGHIFIAGGNNIINNKYNTVDKIKEYNPINDTWIDVGVLPMPIAFAGLSVVGNNIFIYGGSDATNTLTFYNTVYELMAPISNDNALLNIIMTNGQRKEYDLTSDKITDFVSWYNSQAASSPNFKISYSFNMGNLMSRSDYISFGKVAYFEVNSYNNNIAHSPMIQTTGSSLLKITMSTGDILEYEMTTAQMDTFVNWYNSRATSCPTFVINKTYNQGPFIDRTNYIIYNEISDYEIREY